ncbi:ASN_HP2_G0003570.mRNA.1.CDS.1 [Saccharomyces cerevisiae]|nr:BGN_3a_G0003670.mRNA.1.CDS.1 [Saccharomyces cerevisiae]CAI5235563.1 BFH_HP2_G0003580.mRNA.1.CDS.1 [Saccharomyces cerevisiae]CAI5238370.1 ASN_HP2_G0003570.mRNA.1.CDS.1 [Saccharomyces cerevisiae]CAI6396991.1 BFH_HP2_G0003580.mRNA.1.CDS.1 [Saccharomyces cerevisiae]CAI6400185.1 BFH_HP1_G0003650.mRNA.1.CDS.1 [Saccharomyces cerevisiae]
MPILRNLALERNRKINELRGRIDTVNKRNDTKYSRSSCSEISDKSLDNLALGTVQSSGFIYSLEQEIIDEEEPKKNRYQQPGTNKICETSDLKTKFAPYTEMLEKKTNKKIKEIIRKKMLLLAYPNDNSSD